MEGGACFDILTPYHGRPYIMQGEPLGADGMDFVTRSIAESYIVLVGGEAFFALCPEFQI